MSTAKTLYALVVLGLCWWLWLDGDKRGAAILFVTAGVAVVAPSI